MPVNPFEQLAKNQSTDNPFDGIFSNQQQSESDYSSAFIPSEHGNEDFNKNDYGLTNETDQEKNRSINQGTVSEVGNGLGRAALNLIPSVIGNIASIGDLEDYYNQDKEVGNDITRWTESLKEQNKKDFPIYGENQLETLDMGKSEWWTSNMTSLAESAGAFAITGAGLGYGVKGIQLLSKLAGAGAAVQKAVQGIGGISTAIALNQAEAVTSGMQVYDQAYQTQIAKNPNDIEGAKQIAADAAAYTININRLNLPLNITSSLAFIRPTELTRQAIKQAGMKAAVAKMGSEGGQEFGEEIINKVAEDEGKRYGQIGKEYNYNANNTINDVFSAQGLEAGLLGFLGGVAQTGTTELINEATGKNKEQNILYDKQQTSLKQLEQLSNSQDLKTVLANVKDQTSIINDLNDAEGDELKTQTLKNELLVNQAVNSFESGTTDKLENIYDQISKTPEEEGVSKYGKEYKKSALDAKTQIRKWEHEWNKSIQNIPDTYDKKAIFKNKLQQISISEKINDLKQEESKVIKEGENIKLNSEENATIPQEIELKTIRDNIAKLQTTLNTTQIKANEYFKPIEKTIVKKTLDEETKEFKQKIEINQNNKKIIPEILDNSKEIEPLHKIEKWEIGKSKNITQFLTIKYRKNGDKVVSPFNSDSGGGHSSVYNKNVTTEQILSIWKEPNYSPKLTALKKETLENEINTNNNENELELNTNNAQEAVPVQNANVQSDNLITNAPNVSLNLEDDLVEVIKGSHSSYDIGKSEKSANQVAKYTVQENWRKAKEQQTSTIRFSKLLEKKGIDPTKFNINTVEQLFKDSGQQAYFDANRDSITVMIAQIGLATGTVTPLSFDKKIQPEVSEELKEELSEESGLKRTTGLNGAYKIVKQNEYGGSLKSTNGFENKAGTVQFETNAYDDLHTNDIKLGDALELRVEGEIPQTEEITDATLDQIAIQIVDKTTGKFRFYVSTIKSITVDSLDLDEAGLEKEREKLRKIRTHFLQNPTSTLISEVQSVGIGKLEWNGNPTSINKIPDVQAYLHVKTTDGKIIGQSSETWVTQTPKQEWFDKIPRGSVILTLPEANHQGGFHARPIPVETTTFKGNLKTGVVNNSSELAKIRSEVKQELFNFIEGKKTDLNLLNKWVYVQRVNNENQIDPAQLGKKGIQLKGKSIIFLGKEYSTVEDIDGILDQLQVNVNAKLLADPNSDYASRLLNSDVLQSNIAYKVIKDATIFAFHPTFIYSQPVESQEETKTEEPKINDEVDNSGQFSLDNVSFDITNSNPILPLQGNEQLYGKYKLLNKSGGLKNLSQAEAKKWEKTLNKSPFNSFRTVKSTFNGQIVYKIIIEDKSNSSFDISVKPSIQFNINPSFTLNQEDKIINSLAYEILNDKSKKELIRHFNDFLTALEKGKTEENAEATEARKELITNTLNSLDEYIDKANQLLETLNFAKDEIGFYNEFIDADNSLDQMQDEAAFTEIRVDSIPENVRKFLMYIPMFKNDGTIKWTALGLKTFAPVDITFNKIATLLSKEYYSNTQSSLEDMLTLLSEHPDPLLNEVAVQLKKANNEQLQNQFYRAFNQQIIDSRSFLISKKEKGFGIRIARADKSSAFNKLKQEWNVDFNEKFVTNNAVNTTKGKELFKKFDTLLSDPKSFLKFDTKNSQGNIIKTEHPLTNESKLELISILENLGIKVTVQGLNAWLTNDKNYSKSKERNDKLHLQNTLLYVFQNVAGISNKETNSTDEDVTTKNNPFENETKHIESLAYNDSSFTKIQGGSSFRHNGKQYSSFVRHMPLDTQLSKMKQLQAISETATTNKLTSKPVFRHSFYAKFLNTINFIVERGLKMTKKGSKSKNLNDANEKEHEAIKILTSQNSNYFKTDTLSDKTTNVFFNVPRVAVSLNKKGNVDENTKTHLNRYFQMEYDRIHSVKKRMDATGIKYNGFDSTKDQKGAGEYFLMYEFLNYETLGDSANEQQVKERLYDSDGKLKDISLYKGVYPEGSTKDLYEILMDSVNNLISNRVNAISDKIKKDWESLDIYSVKDGITTINDIDAGYRERLKKRLETTKQIDGSTILGTDRNILLLAIKDYTVNYMTQTMEMLWLYGDPALQSKIKYSKNKNTLTKEELIKGIKDTFTNVGKRNASLMAQSEAGKWEKNEYKIAFIDDVGINSNNLEEYHASFRSDYEDAGKDGKEGEKMTDAQEFTTVQEHLEDVKAFGEKSKNLFYLGMMHFDPETYNSKGFDKKYPEKPAFKELTDFEISQLNGILQPRKPVQVFTKFTDEGLQVKYYIKTSSVPLIPSVVKGSPMEDVLKSMKKNGVQRIVFNSGVKIGKGGSTQLFKDGEVHPDLFKDSVHTLERSGYGIQLNVPYDEGKNAIRQVTQAMKLLFVNMDDSMVLSNGMTVKKAKERYAQIEIKLVQDSIKSLNKELLATDGVIKDMTVLAEILTKEGLGRGYTQNTLAGLKTDNGKFKIPLTYSPNIGQIQPVLTSLVNNRIIRQKIPGKSYVQVSEILTYLPKNMKEKFNRPTSLDKLSDKAKNSIIWINEEAKNKGKLNFITRGESQSNPAEIIAPWYFVVDKKKVLITEFIDENGYLDLSKLDPKLLEMHGFRIPNQAHSSMMHFKIVGFLPEGMGDSLVVPSEIAIQMGSDYDVDKLYVYNYEFNNNPEGLTKKKSEINELIDIHKTVILTNSMFDVVTKPQGFNDLKSAIEEMNKSLPNDDEWLGSYNPIYQRKEFFDNAAGKSGVGIASNHNTQHSLSQQANLYIKETGVLFKQNDGKYFSETPKDNRVNEYEEKIYSYLDGEVEVDMEEETSAWRLDKKLTFSGKLISDIIAEWQGASVDNAKEKLLGTGGINDYNLSVSLLIARTGFDNEWILNFINQPILKEYYKTVDSLKSIFNDSYESDRRNKAIDKLFEQYGIAQEDINKFKSIPFEAYTLGEYKNMLSKKDSLDESEKEKQLNILKAFLHYEKLALSLATLQSVTSVDVKGLPKNITETAELHNKQLRIGSLALGNVKKLWKTAIGAFLDIPGYAVKLYSEVFDYNTPAYNNVINTLKTIQKADEFTDDQLNKIYNNLYSFIYTLSSIQEAVADGKNVEEYKQSLVLGENTLSDKLEKFKQLYPDNLLISKISRVLDNVNSAKRIQLDSTFSKTESYDKELTSSWLDMIRENQPDLELKQFGLDLAAYAMYFNNEPYGISNFMKYIPIEYFDAIGFGEKLSTMHDQLKNSYFLTNFTEQYFQHNVDEARSGTALKTTEKTDNSVTFAGTSSLVAYTDPKTGHEYYVEYVKMYNTKTSSFDLYKLQNQDSLTYNKINQLGIEGFNEYNFNNSKQQSLLKENKTENVIEQPKLVTSVKKKLIEYKDYFKYDNAPITNSKDLLKNVLEQSIILNNSDFEMLARELLKLPTEYEIKFGKLKQENALAKTRTSADSKTITFDVEKYKNKSDFEIQRSILHEWIHSVTQFKLNDPAFKETPEYKQLVNVWDKWKASLSTQELIEAEDFKKRFEAQKKGDNNSFDSLEDFEGFKSKYYAYVSLDEFVTQSMTDRNFQKILDSIEGKSDGLWSDFVNVIKKIIKSVTGNTLLDEAVESIVNVIKYEKQGIVENVSNDLGISIGELMKEMTPEQRAKFRELREKGIFTTKC